MKKVVIAFSIIPIIILGILAILPSCSAAPGTGSSSSSAAVNTSGPDLQISSPLNNATNTNGIIAVTGTASDSDGVSGVFMIVGTGSQVKIGTTNFNTNLILTNGSYNIKLSALDVLGNISSIHEINVVVNTNLKGPDIYPPVMTISSLQNNMTNTTGTLAVSGTAVDQSGVEGVYLAVNFGSFGKIGAATFNTNLSLSNGVYTLQLFAKDISNNISSTNVFSNIVVDTNVVDSKAPSVAITFPSADGAVLTTHDVNIQGNITDPSPSSGVSNVFISTNGTSYFNPTISGTSWNCQFTGLPNAGYQVWSYGVDNAGNVSATNSRTFTVNVPNVGLNTGFEYWSASTPTGWTNGYDGLSSETNFDSVSQSSTANSGNYSVQLQWVGNVNNKYPLFGNTNYIPVTTGSSYVAAFYAKSTLSSPYAAPEIKFYDNNKNYITVVWGTLTALTTSWNRILTIGTAPVNAAYARIFIEGHKAYDGTMLADDFIFTNVTAYDTVNPSIDSLTAPADNYTNTVNCLFNVTGTASDDISLKAIYAAIGGITNSVTLNLSSWSIPVNTAGLTNSNYTLSVWAQDYANNMSAISNINVTLTNSGTAVLPIVTLAAYNFDGSTNVNSGSYQNVTASDVSNNGVTKFTYSAGNPGSGKAISLNSWTNGIFQYFGFTLTPSGNTINMTQLQFDGMRSATGPQNILIRSSADNFASDITNLINLTNFTASPMFSVDLSAFSNIASGANITFRIYATNSSSASGTFRIDDVTFFGNIY